MRADLPAFIETLRKNREARSESLYASDKVYALLDAYDAALTSLSSPQEPVAWQWKLIDTWYTVDKHDTDNPEKYARGIAGAHGQVRAIFASPVVPVVAKGEAEGWRLIDGPDPAPKDGTIVDLWLLNRKTGAGRREPDCKFSQSQSWPYWISKAGELVTGKRYTDRYGDWRCDPGCADEESVVATHWRFPPAAPTREGEGQ